MPCLQFFTQRLQLKAKLAPSHHPWWPKAQGLGLKFCEPRLSKAKPKPGLLGQAGPAHHYSRGHQIPQKKVQMVEKPKWLIVYLCKMPAIMEGFKRLRVAVIEKKDCINSHICHLNLVLSIGLL
jgi:hypothetical protein